MYDFRNAHAPDYQEVQQYMVISQNIKLYNDSYYSYHDVKPPVSENTVDLFVCEEHSCYRPQYMPEKKCTQKYLLGVIKGRENNKESNEDRDAPLLDEKGEHALHFLFPNGQQTEQSFWMPRISPYAGKHEGMCFPYEANSVVIIAFFDAHRPYILGAATHDNEVFVTAQNSQKNILKTKQNLLEIDDTRTCEKVTLHSNVQNSCIQIGTMHNEHKTQGASVTTDGTLSLIGLKGGSNIQVTSNYNDTHYKQDSDSSDVTNQQRIIQVLQKIKKRDSNFQPTGETLDLTNPAIAENVLVEWSVGDQYVRKEGTQFVDMHNRTEYQVGTRRKIIAASEEDLQKYTAKLDAQSPQGAQDTKASNQFNEHATTVIMPAVDIDDE